MRSITTQGVKSVRRIPRLLTVGLALLICLIVPALASAQDPAGALSPFLPRPVKEPPVPLSIPIARLPNLVNTPSKTGVEVGTSRVITLEEAQQAAAGQNPMVRLGQLQVEAAKQNRQVFAASYFPQISSTFANLHFNKFMGEQIQLRRPIQGTTTSASLPLLGKDLTLAAFTVMQPLTPLLKVQQAVKIARADENIARAKAGMPISETSRNVEKNYFDLLIAQRELTIAQLKSKRVQDKSLIASNSSAPRLSAEQEAEMIEAEKTLVVVTSKVRELSASLNGLIGLPAETELELVRPAPRVENVSLSEATQKALESNPEVIEAEQTAIKARAGRKLAKLDYVPDVVVLGGYAYQANLLPLLPRDFSFIGVMATYSIFDGGKREHTLKQRKAQVEMAELAVTLTKAKVAGAVKTSYFEMERSRVLTELSQRMISASEVVNVSHQPDSFEVKEARARMEAEVLRAESAYREALGKLRSLMGDR
ncbi:MAG: TolC family protein [Pyrinomonadaceae bacterium]|nr:TolC family protein [Pyrinomonadaceae bacterium]